MHTSSMNEMSNFVKRYLKDKKNITILDVGSYNVNGIYKELFTKDSWEYKGLDVISGPNVDIVVTDPYKWTIDNNSFDVVISGQAFEHIEYPWLTMVEIYRVLKPNGIICIIVPTTQGEHKYPIDCWRIFPDGMKALAKYANLKVLECYRNSIYPCCDCILIGGK